ncbi:MAG: DEAD/DEAH box helicase family protein [Sulfurovum sp.]|nr:DEAD/DEAH box helicase family protein [Sulfurovum sp.]
MDRVQKTSSVIKQLNNLFEGKIKDYEFINVVCSYFDIIKEDKLSPSDLKFLKYISNIAGVPHYYDLLFSKFNHDESFNKYDLNTVSSIIYESTLYIDENIKIHRYQKKILNKYRQGKQNRFFLSASTSFGKTFLIYEIIKKMNYKNIVLIFPTIALLSENYERIMTDDKYQYFHDNFSIHTLSEVNEDDVSENNIYIYTPERYLSFIDKNSNIDIDFIFVDEIYKVDNEYIIDNISKENERDTAYRIALFHILSNTKDILLVGPYIEFPNSNDPSINQSFNIFLKENSFEIINYNKFEIVNKSYHIINGSKQFKCDSLIIDLSGFSKKNKGEKLAKIVDDIRSVNENAIFYTRGAGSAEKIAKNIIENSLSSQEVNQNLEKFIIHLEKRFNLEDWILIKSLKNKIGIHHGLVPKYIQKEIINLFNNGELDFLISTTTITEGVNTSAKNLIIDSIKKGDKDLKTFDAKNIAGRAGRFLHHYSGRVLILKKEFEEVLNGIDNAITHKNYDKYSPKDEIDLFITDEEYLNKDNKSERQKIKEEQEKRNIPDKIMQMYKVISHSDKIELYDRLVKLSESSPKQYREMQTYINKLGGFLYIDYRGFQIISHIFKPIVTNDNLKQLMEREIKNQYKKSSLLTNLLYFYFKDGFMGSVKYKIEKQNKSTDDAMKESAQFTFNTLKYQLVKYLGVFNIMYKFLESQKKEIPFDDIHGIERLLMKLEYNAISEKGRLASDYGVPNKIIEYYDNEENRDTIRKQFDAYEEEKFKNIEAILV